VITGSLRAPWWWQVLLALLTSSAAFGLTLLVHLEDRPYLLPTVAVLLATVRGGLIAGAMAGIITILLVSSFILPPVGQFGPPATPYAYELIVFAVTTVIISVLVTRGRQAQLTLEATLASIGDGVIVTDNDGRVTFLNTVAQQLTGWPLKEATGQKVPRVFVVVSEETRRPVSNPVERALRQNAIVGLIGPTMLISRDGGELPIADSAAPIRDASGRTLGAVLVFRDASAQRAAELAQLAQAREREALLERERDAREEAERANRLKDEFLATLSHELRTPLNAVLGWSHMLTRRQLSSEQQTQALAAIHRNAQAQARLVDDVLDLSRIVTGRMALTSDPVDVSDVVRSTCDAFMPALLGKRQELRLDLQNGAVITGDQHRLRQVVWNLLSNATKFTPDGGTISIRVKRTDDRIDLAITDTGQGIETAFLPFVFDRFRQADGTSTRGHGGLGLGLALVRHIAEAHGGTASAWSAGPGKGATVRVSLPTLSTASRRVADERALDDGPRLGRLRLGEDAP
jgi:PAS domain S-box-containing protein